MRIYPEVARFFLLSWLENVFFKEKVNNEEPEQLRGCEAAQLLWISLLKNTQRIEKKMSKLHCILGLVHMCAQFKIRQARDSFYLLHLNIKTMKTKAFWGFNCLILKKEKRLLSFFYAHLKVKLFSRLSKVRVKLS